jgi:hypothetical protein
MKLLDHRLLLAVLVAATLVTGTAFADTYGTTLQWQQRGDVSVSVADVEIAEDDSKLAVSVVVHNELDHRIEVLRSVVGVYPGEPPYADGSELNHPHSTMSSVTAIGPGEHVDVTITTQLRDDSESKLRDRVENGNVSISGSLMIELQDRRYSVDVPS